MADSAAEKWKDTGITRGMFDEQFSNLLSLYCNGVIPKTFSINCYLNEGYSFVTYTTEGTSCLAAILTALLEKDSSNTIHLCVWTLASFKTTLLEDADGELCSFVQKLGAKASKVDSKPGTYATDPAIEEWVKAASREPGFEVFTLALAMFTIGFAKRKPISRENLSRHGKWKHSLAAMCSFKRPLPRKIKIDFLKDIALSDPDKKSACGACLFLEGTILGRKLREPINFGILRPVCDNHTLLSRRFQEFKKLYPEAFFRDSKFPTIPLVLRGVELLNRLDEVLTEAKNANAELQPLMIRSIDRGYLGFLGEPTVKNFQSYLFFCICNRKGRRGRENWEAFLQVSKKNPKVQLTYLRSYENWVSSLRVK